MFDLPDAKRVKRSKLFSTFSSSEDENDVPPGIKSRSLEVEEPDVSMEKDSENISQDESQTMQIDYGFEYEFIDKSKLHKSASNLKDTSPTKLKSKPKHPTHSKDEEEPISDIAASIEPAEPRDETYAFNLFAPKPNPEPTHITIHSPTPPPLSLTALSTSGGRILKPRPQSYYFTSPLPLQKQQFLTSALSGTSILSLSTSAWPGTHLPWRIIAVPNHKLILRDPLPTTKNGKDNRPRPSKKRRIQLRQRVKARQAIVQASVVSEEAEREKRTRRNRKKKVKRKMREKAKKLLGEGHGQVGGDGVDESGSESGDV